MTAPREEFGALEVRLGTTHVGTLTLLADDRSEFVLSEDYRQRYPRPVLGQTFEEEPLRRHTSRMRLPPFFSNLLPEGALRKLIAEKDGLSQQREFFLIARLGEDLPGAVVVTPRAPLPWELAHTPAETPSTRVPEPEQLRFSLAGVQLKFSMLREGRGMTLPMSGQGGDWIVKLPDNRFDHVPANEFSMMTWARATGIEVPELELVRVADLHGLPEGLPLREDQAFAIRRFDRPTPGHRVHMEDMAQVLGLYSDEKYDKYNYETVAKILLNVAGPDSLHEFLRRLVFIIAIGNGDAHHKNWSLLYPDGLHARLSPAYDLVSTLPYMPNDTLALNLARSKRFNEVSSQGFERLARKLDLESAEVLRTVKAAVEATRQAWGELRTQLPLPEPFKQRLERHWETIPLFNGT